MKIKSVISNLRLFTENNCNETLDPKLCEDIRYLCDELERMIKNQTEHQHYKTKLEKCIKKLLNYEPF